MALEYEQNQFYDPVAQQSLPAGGLRIRTIKALDPVTRVETRRDYRYQQAGTGNAGISSGVLLHVPRFAFVMPLTSSTQWANATAAEVIFSDFETEDKPCSFSSSGARFTAAARTGTYGYAMPAGISLTAMLPASTAPQYRLVFWARTTGVANGTVTIRSGASTPFSGSFSGTSQWQYHEILLPVGSLVNRTTYQVALTANASNSADLQVDDVLLLPADATAASTTYALALGKTSETDARGRTTYYEYAPTGDLALVRDHNQAILHQYQKVLPGQTMLEAVMHL